MAHLYTYRDAVTRPLHIAGGTTDDDALIDSAIEGVSRQIDDYLGYAAGPSVGTRYYTAQESECLYLDEPVTSITAINTDPGGDGVYELALSSSCYYPTGAGKDFNARSASPPRPYWELHIRQTSTAVFPAGVERGVEITGTWGYTNQTKSTTATVATGYTANGTDLAFNGATALHVGQTVLIDSEQILLRENGTASNFTVERGMNGTNATTHSSGAVVAVYQYPVISKAAQHQAGMEYRAAQMPLGYGGGDAGGQQRIVGAGSLHPFTRRMIDPMRKPVTA